MLTNRRPTAFAVHIFVIGGQVGAGVAISLAAARHLGPGGRGVLAQALQAAYLIALVVTAGLDRVSAGFEPGPTAAVLVRAGVRRYVLACVILALAAASGVFDSSLQAVEPVTLTAGFAAGLIAVRLLGVTALATPDVTIVVNRRRTVLIAGGILGAALAWVLDFGPVGWLAVAYVAPHAAMMFVERDRLGGSTACASVIRSAAAKVTAGPVAQALAVRGDRYLLIATAGPADLARYLMVASAVEILVFPSKLVLDRAVAGRTAQLPWPSWMASAFAGIGTVAAGVWAIPALLGPGFGLPVVIVVVMALAGAGLTTQTLTLARLASDTKMVPVGPEVLGLSSMVPVFAVSWVLADPIIAAAVSSAVGYWVGAAYAHYWIRH